MVTALLTNLARTWILLEPHKIVLSVKAGNHVMYSIILALSRVFIGEKFSDRTQQTCTTRQYHSVISGLSDPVWYSPCSSNTRELC